VNLTASQLEIDAVENARRVLLGDAGDGQQVGQM
jgi:hypothetical protein